MVNRTIDALDTIDRVSRALRNGIRSGWDLDDLPFLDDIARDLEALLDHITEGRI